MSDIRNQNKTLVRKAEETLEKNMYVNWIHLAEELVAGF
jgi:hypothetical protein